MPEQLKIIIDADVNSAIAGVQKLSKVISLDFANATRAASSAANNLSSDVAASVKKINASLSSLKITSLDVSVNTSTIDASIKNIQSKCASLVDPELNIFANTAQAEAKIKELLADLSTLKGSEIFIKANDVQALKAINEIEAELNSLVGKQINLSVTADLSKINELKAKLSTLKVTPVDISINTAGIDASIKSIQTKFSALVDPQINVLANTELAEAKIKELLGDLSKLRGSEIFIRANDVQALKAINEIEAELNSLADKQIKLNVTTTGTGTIEAVESVKKLDTTWREFVGQRMGAYMKQLGSHGAAIKQIAAEWKDFKANLSTQIKPNIDTISLKEAAKVISVDFVKATEVAQVAAFDLSGRVSVATGRINAFIDKMVADALGSFSKLNTVRPDFGVLSFDSSKALADINLLKSELSSIKITPIKIPVDNTAALERINVLERELISLEALKISPDISSTQLNLFEANIQRIKGELASLKGQGISIPILVPPVPPNAFKSINDLEREIDELKTKINFSKDVNEIRKLGDEFKRVQTQINNIRVTGGLSGQLDKLGTSSKNAANSLRSLPNVSNQATFALTNLGRVVQDAPFGFLGIANNLNPLLESFERLKETSGSTGKALKAVAGSLLGAGGLGFAVSIVSSLLLVFGGRLFGAGKSASQAKTGINEFADAAKEAASSFAETATKATSLVSALSGGNLNLKERKAALEELKTINQEFFGSLKEENGLIVGLQSAYDGYILRLKEIGKTKAIESQLTKLFDRKLQLELSIDPKFISQTDASVQRVLGRLQNELKSLGGPIDVAKEKFDAFNKTQARRVELAQKIDLLESGQQIRVLGEGVNVTTKEISNLNLRIEALSKLLSADGTFDIKIPKPNTKEFDKFQDDIIAQAKLAAAEFGKSFVVPDLEVTFFKNKDAVFSEAKKFLLDVNSFLGGQINALKMKIPVQPDIEFLPIPTGVSKEIEELFFKSAKIEKGIDVTVDVLVTPDFTLAKGNLDAIDKKVDLRKQFSILGDLGLKEFAKIDFSNMNAGLAEASKRLEQMMAIATTLNQAIGQGLSNAFNAVFDAVLEGKSVFKALAGAVKELIVTTIRAVAQMLILRLVTNLIFPGAGAAGGIGKIFGSGFAGAGFGAANFGQLSGIGSRAFNNVLTVNVVGNISGDVINLAGQRAANSQGRFG